jgi:hypothetical protein
VEGNPVGEHRSGARRFGRFERVENANKGVLGRGEECGDESTAQRGRPAEGDRVSDSTGFIGRHYSQNREMGDRNS